MQIFVTKYIKNGQESWVFKNVRGGNVYNYNSFIAKPLEKKINNLPGIFSFVVGVSY